MAIYLPAHHLALEVIDDPRSMPVDRRAFPRLDVAPVTQRELESGTADTGALEPRKGDARRASLTPAEVAARKRLFRLLRHGGRELIDAVRRF